MFSYAFIFITLTLLTLILAAFWLKVPNASFPLIVIYAIFIFNNKSPDSDNERIDIEVTENLKNEINSVSELGIKTSFNGLVNIKPKPITIDTEKNQKRITESELKKTIAKKKIDKKPLIKENVSTQALVVKDIKICKKIYKRTPVGSDIVFTNSVDSLYCYTRIQNTGSKKEVKHIWYFENQIMTQVRYNVKKSNIYRSWTKKTILPHQIGKWRVDVHDNYGTIIGSKEFQIKNISSYN